MNPEIKPKLPYYRFSIYFSRICGPILAILCLGLLGYGFAVICLMYSTYSYEAVSRAMYDERHRKSYALLSIAYHMVFPFIPIIIGSAVLYKYGGIRLESPWAFILYSIPFIIMTCWYLPMKLRDCLRVPENKGSIREIID